MQRSNQSRTLGESMMEWIDERFQIREPLREIAEHPVPRHARAWYYCLGGVSFFFFFIQVVTGILLAMYYQATPDKAYNSVMFIMNEVKFGWLVRSMHAWSANLMVAAVFMHMLRVFFTGAYKPPRELNWVAGVGLLGITLAFGFTGYLLPWDQRAYWATTVGTEIAGSLPLVGPYLKTFLLAGTEPTGLTLARFYAMHVLVLPLVAVILLALHFLMVRRQGISGPL